MRDCLGYDLWYHTVAVSHRIVGLEEEEEEEEEELGGGSPSLMVNVLYLIKALGINVTFFCFFPTTNLWIKDMNVIFHRLKK